MSKHTLGKGSRTMNKDVRILIVEDSPTQAEQLKHLLEEQGYTANVAGNGRQALAAAKKYNPTLVISDVVMPEMDGYTFCKELKSDDRLKDIPVILVTQLSSAHDVITGLECGADNFILKPYDEKYLLSRIQYILTNLELRKREKTRIGVEIYFAGQKYFITSERQQILDLLLSTYETAVQQNKELVKTRDELKALNEQLEQKVEERTSDLKEEIAERKRTEEMLRKVNRALNVLSQCNQALIRARDEQGLLGEICRIIVELGEYRMAWVGFAEEDNAKTVRPAAQSGYEEGYLEGAKVTWADTERGQSPIGVAIRTGSIDIARDVQTDPRFKPWREEALKRGYHSAIGLPLTIDKTNIGGLAIYAAEPDAFDTMETNLLMELADDLAFGITSLRTAVERKQAEKAVIKEKTFTETALNTLSDIFFVFDVSGKFLRWNKTASTVLGYTDEEISAMRPTDFFSGEDIQRVTETIGKVMKEGNASVEASFVTKDNKKIPYEIFGSLLKDPDGNYIDICGVGRDITDRKKFEDELRKREEELKNRVKELEDFYNMSVGRELKMKELKEEIESLKDELTKYRRDKDI